MVLTKREEGSIMADYFLVLDADPFERQVRPALAASWRQRSFEPCRALCASLLPAARSYAERYHTGADEPLLRLVAQGLPFKRAYWRSLVGEMLLFTAVEIPEFQTCADTLCLLLAPANYRAGIANREQFAPIQQVHRGTRDLTFGAAVYRPDHAGYNNREDVARLSEYLATVRPEMWTAADLDGLRGAEGEEDRADELALARDWFPVLQEFFRHVCGKGQVIVHENIY
jgi:hypothetical protein